MHISARKGPASRSSLTATQIPPRSISGDPARKTLHISCFASIRVLQCPSTAKRVASPVF